VECGFVKRCPVTHNEALAILDALLHLAVLDRDRGEPPHSPAEGDRYIVAQNPTGAWAGKAGTVAVFDAGGWEFHAPKEGWLAWATDENSLLVHDGSSWNPFGSGSSSSELQNLALLGIGTTADAANPFSAKLNTALWAAKTAAEGGNGDLRYTLNKEAAADVLSLLMQRGFEGRAEFGLIGDDDWRLKVSPDGATWTDAIVVSQATGAVSMPNTAGGGGAPADAPYIVAASDGALKAERVATQSSDIDWDFATAGQAKALLRDGAATNAKLADMPSSRIKGRASAGSGDPEDLTAAQARALLNVADGANNYAHPNHSGEVTSAGDGATTIAANAVTNAKLADVATATIKGRAAAGAGDPEDLTGTQATALLDVMVGSGASARKGLAPAPPASAGTSLFLREDATWAAPPAGEGACRTPSPRASPRHLHRASASTPAARPGGGFRPGRSRAAGSGRFSPTSPGRGRGSSCRPATRCSRQSASTRRRRSAP
jgi:hypothetical protein